MSERAKALAEQHWDGYVGGLVAVHLTKDTYTKEEVLAMCRYHYVSSHIHGAKHEAEARQEISGKAMDVDMTSILRYPPAHPFKHKDEVEDVPVCTSCGVADECHGPLKGKGCWAYVATTPPSPPADPWAERDLCRRCDYEPCGYHGQPMKTATCDTYANRTKQPHLACTKP